MRLAKEAVRAMVLERIIISVKKEAAVVAGDSAEFDALSRYDEIEYALSSPPCI